MPLSDWVELVAFHAVKLCDGALDDGMINGNMLRPQVNIMPSTLIMLEQNARKRKLYLLSRLVSTAPTMAAIGAAIIQ